MKRFSYSNEMRESRLPDLASERAWKMGTTARMTQPVIYDNIPKSDGQTMAKQFKIDKILHEESNRFSDRLFL